MELASLNPCTVSSASIRVDTGGISDVDLLFVIDNSSSMASEQVKLAAQLPQLVSVLVSGDRYAGRTPPAGISDKERYFTPVTSLHLGVVSSSMGGMDEAISDGIAIADCVGLGDDGVLRSSTAIAVDGLVNREGLGLLDYKIGEQVFAPEPGCADIGDQPSYQDYQAGEDTTPEQLAQSFACVSRLGVLGCPFEQQLEAMWKAVAPSNGKDPTLHTFLNGTRGHGEPSGVNEGFVREKAILAVIEVSDEEDCSVNQDGTLLFSMSDEAVARFGGFDDINSRCARYGDPEGLVWSPERYVRGLKSLKPDNEDLIVFAAIVGMPLGTEGASIDQILARDDMQFGDDDRDGIPNIACLTATNPQRPDKAYPGRRFLEVAKGFDDDAVVFSICEDSYAPALDRLIERIASKLTGNCLPQPLVRDADGKVRCDVFEMLAPDVTQCDPARGHDGKPSSRQVAQGSGTSERTVCHMQQVAVLGGERDTSEVGWFYDDFSSDLEECPEGDRQRIAFSFGSLPGGGGAFIECFRPVPRIEVNTHGMDAVNLGCEGQAALCEERSDDAYTLFCTPDNTCQITCENNPQCPPGWVCGTKQASGDGPKYCQIPTCPADDTAAR